MADYLLVVDMQSDYVAVGKAYHEELIAAVNDKIASYPSDRVIYILNRFFWERKDRKKKFATGLLLVSSRIFEKRRASCFEFRTGIFRENHNARSQCRTFQKQNFYG